MSINDNQTRLSTGLLCGVLLAFMAQWANAKELPEKQQMRDKLADMIKQGDKSVDKKPATAAAELPTVDPARPKPLPAASSDPKTRQLYEKALQDYYIYRSEGLQHRRAVFKWQLFSARLIFFIVLGLVASGIVFAAIQFRQGMQGENAADANLSTQVEISDKGIKISSPVIGVIILTLSLAFFYLYLLYVYPIENIF